LHEWLLTEWGTPIGEMWDLETLSKVCEKEGRWTFFLTSAPLHVKGGVGTFKCFAQSGACYDQVTNVVSSEQVHRPVPSPYFDASMTPQGMIRYALKFLRVEVAWFQVSMLRVKSDVNEMEASDLSLFSPRWSFLFIWSNLGISSIRSLSDRTNRVQLVLLLLGHTCCEFVQG